MNFHTSLLYKETLKELMPRETHNVLFLFDFDGTLSPIIPNREKAKMEENTYSLFQQLSDISKTGILTGRSIFDVQNRVPNNIKFIIGEHGLESDFKYIKDNILHLIQTQISDLYSLLITSMKPISDIEIEKKKYSLTIHYRKADCQNISLADILKNPSLLNLFEVKRGDKVFNIFSKNSPNKGTSVIHLFQEFHIEKIFYIGDDVTDEDVFQITDERLISIKVGNSENTKAKYNILLQTEIDIYLENLIKIISKKL